MLLLWTMLESGMYFSAACLVGLRPIQSKFGEWTTNHFQTIKSALGLPHTSAGVRLQSSQQGLKNQKPRNPNSLTFIMNIDSDNELGDLGTYNLDHGNNHEHIREV